MLKWTIFGTALISTLLLQSDEVSNEVLSEPLEPKLIEFNAEVDSQALEVKPAQMEDEAAIQSIEIAPEADIQPAEVKTVDMNDEAIDQPINTKRSMDFLLELRAAYFYPTHRKVRAIYSEGGLYSAEFSFQAWKYLYPWASIGYFQKSGHSLGGHTSTQLQMVPTALGLKALYSLKRVSFYLGLGILGTYVHTNNHSSAVDDVSRWSVGGIAKSGIMVYLNHHLFLDFFCDYSYLQVDFNKHRHHVIPHSADLSSVSAGAGLGYRF